MKYINFVDFDIQEENSDDLTKIFARIKEEIESHYYFNKTYPKKVFVYKHYINFMADKTPVTKNNMIIAI